MSPPPYPPESRRWPDEPLRVPAPPRRRRRRRAPRGLVVLLGVLAALVLCLAAFWLAVPLAMQAAGGRTNLLLVGVDQQQGAGWQGRTDTIMILTLNPADGGGGLLSVPRDLQVAIPTYGEDRVNTANVYGYTQGYPGDGPALLRDTIALNFDIPIDGYVMLDFQAFVRIVDSLGGVDVDVPAVLHDTQYPNPMPVDPYATKTVHFDPGPQHMDGRRALEYARSRMSTSDFDRARRQQQILGAVRQQAFSLAAVPRWPSLAAAVLGGVKTDLSPLELVLLARLAARLDPSSLEQVVIQAPLVDDYQRADGALVELPNWSLINPLLEEMFGPPGSR